MDYKMTPLEFAGNEFLEFRLQRDIKGGSVKFDVQKPGVDRLNADFQFKIFSAG